MVGCDLEESFPPLLLQWQNEARTTLDTHPSPGSRRGMNAQVSDLAAGGRGINRDPHPCQCFSGLPLSCPHSSYMAEERLHSQLLLLSTRFQAQADFLEEQKPLGEGGKLLQLLLTKAAHQYPRGLSDSTQPCPSCHLGQLLCYWCKHLNLI